MNMENNFFTKNFKTFLIIPCVIICAALILTIFGAGLNAGIDFTGGSLLTYNGGEDFDVSVVESALKTAGINESQIAKTGAGSVKGFAITLLIGVIVSMISSILITRFLLNRATKLGFDDAKLWTR